MRRLAVAAAIAVAMVSMVGCRGGDDAAPPPSTAPRGPIRSINAPPLPDARTEVAGAAWQHHVVVAGGMNADGSASSRVDLFDTTTGAWSQAPPLPVPVHHAGAAVAGGRLWVVGGFTNGAGQPWVAVANAVSIGPGDAAWKVETPLPRPRGALGLAAARDVLVAVGGVVDGQPARSTLLLRPGQAWSDGPELSTAREHLAVAAAGPRVYAIAGRAGGMETNVRTVESLDIRTGRGWRAVAALAHPRGGTSAASSPDAKVVCVAGGEEAAGTIGAVECLVEGRWVAIGTLQVPRHGLAVVWQGDGLHVVGGGPQPGLTVSPDHELFTKPLG